MMRYVSDDIPFRIRAISEDQREIETDIIAARVSDRRYVHAIDRLISVAAAYADEATDYVAKRKTLPTRAERVQLDRAWDACFHRQMDILAAQHKLRRQSWQENADEQKNTKR